MIVLTQFATAAVAVVAMILSLTTLSARVDAIQQSRVKSAVASCQLLRRVVIVAAGREHRKQAAAFLALSDLSDCNAYAKMVTSK